MGSSMLVINSFSIVIGGRDIILAPIIIPREKDKVISFAGQLLPHIDKVKGEIDKMPDLTLEDSINRMATFTRGMSKFHKK